MTSIEARVKQVVGENLDVSLDQIANEHSFRDDLGADSLNAVELVMAFEDAFSVEIPDEAARKLLTVQSVIDFVTEQLNAPKEDESLVA